MSEARSASGPAARIERSSGPAASEIVDCCRGESSGRSAAIAAFADARRDILLADLAIAEGDRELAAAVAKGPFLTELTSRTPAATPERTFGAATVDVVRDPDDFQAQPRLAITVTGTMGGERWSSTYHVLATTQDARIEREVPEG